ncbi:alpha/beta hydrolase [Nocardioides caldifontis]|uniref:alpha/beta hydrolase n=1 Tax=Nocardioides caldifontis TaxID=2588938 RepID=UPI0011DFD65B|nr:alpha/beta hydrolase [Nocardioides caldifontis]
MSTVVAREGTTRFDPSAVTPQHPEPGLADALALAALYTDEIVLGTVRDTHRAVADRVFGAARRATLGGGRLPQLVHDGVASSVYGGVGLALRATASACSAVGARQVGPRLDDSAAGRVLHSAVNGLIGDRLREEHPHLALAMTVRVNGKVVPVHREALQEAYPDATGKVVVLLHGLGEHEGHWASRAERVGGTYATRLAARGWTPVLLRANTGLPVAENGVALTSLLQQLTTQWPARVDRLAIVGHSMGGLVARAACAVELDEQQPWTERLTDVVTLGTPHLGADLALGASHGAKLLGLLPEAAAFGRIIDHRSPGIRDLERGLPDLPPLPHVRYRLVSAALGDERSIWGRLLGDLLVRRGSATGTLRSAVRLFPDAEVLHLPNADHFSLLNHADVHRALERWLD